MSRTLVCADDHKIATRLGRHGNTTVVAHSKGGISELLESRTSAWAMVSARLLGCTTSMCSAQHRRSWSSGDDLLVKPHHLLTGIHKGTNNNTQVKNVQKKASQVSFLILLDKSLVHKAQKQQYSNREEQ